MSVFTSGTASNLIATSEPTFKKEEDEKANLKAYMTLREAVGEEEFMELVANKKLMLYGLNGKYKITIDQKVYLTQQIDFKDINGQVIKTRSVTWKLCVSSSDKLPEADRILALYLAIKNDEVEFIKSANFRGVTTKDEYMEQSDGRISSIEYSRPASSPCEPDCGEDECDSG